MEENWQNIDDLFRDSIGSMKIPGGNHIWDSLKAKLDEEDAKKYRNKFIIARRFAAAVLALLVIVVLVDYSKFSNEMSLQFQSSTVLSSPVKTLQATRNPSTGLVTNSFNRSDSSVKSVNRSVSPVRLRMPSFSTDINTAYSIPTEYPNRLFPLNLTVYEPTAMELPVIASISNPEFKKLESRRSGLQIRVEPMHLSNRSRPWEIAALGSAVWAHYYLQDDVSQTVFAQNTVQSSLQGSTPVTNRSSLEETENSELSFNAGILAAHHLGKHFGFQTGLIFNSNHISILPQKVYASADASGNIAYELVTSSGYGYVKPNFSSDPTVGDSLYATSARHKLRFLTIPLLMKYNVFFNRLSVSPGLGIALNVLTSSSIETDLQNTTSRETVFIGRLQGTRLIHVSAMVNTEIKYSLDKTWAFDLVPALNYAFTPVTRNSVVKTYPYNFGIGIGVSYKIN